MLANRLLILFTWPSIIAVFALVINDWYLKDAYANWVTGKLSDFAGVFLVSLVLYRLFPKNKILTTIMICFWFTYWKSQYSEPLINLINTYVPIKYGRVVDYTDLVSILILPLSVKLSSQRLSSKQLITMSKYSKAMISFFSIFGVMGTSIAPPIASSIRFQEETNLSIKNPHLVSSVIRSTAIDNKLICKKSFEQNSSGNCFGNNIKLEYFIIDESQSVIVYANQLSRKFDSAYAKRTNKIFKELKAKLEKMGYSMGKKVLGR